MIQGSSVTPLFQLLLRIKIHVQVVVGDNLTDNACKKRGLLQAIFPDADAITVTLLWQQDGHHATSSPLKYQGSSCCYWKWYLAGTTFARIEHFFRPFSLGSIFFKSLSTRRPRLILKFREPPSISYKTHLVGDRTVLCSRANSSWRPVYRPSNDSGMPLLLLFVQLKEKSFHK